MTLRVTLEIVPFGNEDEKRVIEEVNISNLGATDLGVYQYGIEHNKYKTRKYDAVVEHHRQDGAIKLVSLAMEALIGKAERSKD
jgi:hypothetical protein